MVPALILVLAAWCPITTTTTTAAPTTTSTATPTTTTTEPRLIIHPDPFPPAAASTTTTTGPMIVDAATAIRPAPPPLRHRELPMTGPDGDTLVVAGILIVLGGLFVAVRTGTHPPP